MANGDDNKSFKGFINKYKFIIIGLSMLVLFISLRLVQADWQEPVPTKEFYQDIEKDKVEYIVYQWGAPTFTVHLKDNKEYTTNNLGYDGFLKDLTEKGVDDIRTKSSGGGITSILMSFIPFIIIVAIFFLFSRKSMGGYAKMGDINEVEVTNKVTFYDVAGMTEEKEELMTAVMSLKSADTYKDKGFKPIKGVMLEGPPGVGKTLIAKAIAGEAGVNFLSFSGATFNEMFVGVGAMRVKNMFKKAEESKPCVVFIDEIDSVGARRSSTPNGNNEANNTLTAILEKMDGVGSQEGILFVGATNRIDALDEALTRPGRFDRIIHIGAPKSKADREAIIAVHLRGKVLKDGITVEEVGKLCYGLTGAEIASVLNDAVMESIKDGKEGIIDLPHIDSAYMKLMSRGVAKGSHKGHDLKRVAVHEMGHALMNQHLGRKVIKVSVQPYTSGVGGVTMVDGESLGSMSLRSKDDLIGDIKVLYAGMVAEEVVLGNISSGNSNDLERATQLLHNMVATWGMVDGSILSQSYFSKTNALPMTPESILSKMEELGGSIKSEVYEYFLQPSVKQQLIELADQLEKDEVIYSMPEPGDSNIEELVQVSITE